MRTHLGKHELSSPGAAGSKGAVAQTSRIVSMFTEKFSQREHSEKMEMLALAFNPAVAPHILDNPWFVQAFAPQLSAHKFVSMLLECALKC